MSRNRTSHRSRRLNRRALATLVVAALVVVPGLIGLKLYRDRAGRRAYLDEARKHVAAKQTNLALGYLNRYLELNPEDLDALELKARILSDAAVSLPQAQEAVQALSLVLGRLPKGPRAQDARRRVVKLSLRMPDRAHSAEEQARALIADGADDAEAHRLLAQALQSVGVADKNAAALDESRKEYEKAESRDPGDVAGAEQLAYLYRKQLENPAAAAKVLDKLVERTAKDPAKHAAALLARFRHHAEITQNLQLGAEQKVAAARLAEADALEAVRTAPADVDARLIAAELALQAPRYDTATARLHLAAIPEAKRNDLRVKSMEGLIGLVERRPEDAIQAWRAGLVLTGGTDDRMTWRLANILLESGRVAEAEPLIEQYRRLTGGDGREAAARELFDANYHYLHGVALLKSGRLREAITELEAIRYKAAKEVEPHLYYALGLAYEGVREPAKALEVYRQSAELSQDWSSPWTAVARLQAETRPDAAEATLRRGLALMPNDPKLVTALAQVLWRAQMQKPEPRRNWGEVERVLDEARKAAPGSSDLALVMADYYTARQRPDDAIALLRTATGLNPRATELWLALANSLVRRGRPGQALEAIDRAEAPAAAGPQAGLAITRAQVLLIKGRYGDARKALSDALVKVPPGQRPLLWKTLGDFYLSQNDATSARAAYDEWSRIDPENPDPRVSLFRLALAAGDDAAIGRAVEALKGFGGPGGYYWRSARVEDLLRDRPKESADAAGAAKRLDEAEALVKEIEKNDPQIPLGYLLEGRVAERRKQVDRAVAAYRQALRLRAGGAALNPLVALLVRENRTDELRRVREDFGIDPSEFDRLSAVQALRVGDKGRAEQLAEMAVAGDPKGLDVRLWQAEVLKALGKPEAAEAALRVTIAQRPTEAAPWLALLMLQTGQRRPADAAGTIEQMKSRVKVETPELLWAQCYRSIGDLARADGYFQEALRKWPNDAAVQTAAVTFYEQTGRRDAAEAALRALRRRDPSNGWATRKLALSLAGRAGNRAAWDEALALVGADARPDDVPDDLVTRASVYALGPEPAHRATAVAILEGLLGEMPGLAKVREQVARLLFATGDVARARDHAARAAAGAGASPDAILFYASVLLASNDVAGAEGQLERLAALEPDGLPVAELRARVLAARGKPAEGAAALEKAFNDRAHTPDALNVGRLTIAVLNNPPLNQADAAERVARRLAELGPQGRLTLADVLAGRGKADEAAAQLDEAARAGEPAAAAEAALGLAIRFVADRRWPARAERYLAAAPDAANPSPERLSQIALLHHLQGEYDREIATYEKLLAAGPSNFQFLNNMAWTLSEEMNRPRDGLKWAEEAIRRVGPLPQMLDTRGVILARLGRLDDAVKDLETAAQALKDSSVDYHLARVYRKLGKDDAARKYRDRVRRSGFTPAQLQPCDRADWDAVMK